MFFKEEEKDAKCCKCNGNNEPIKNFRFKEKEIPTRYDMAHFEGNSSLAYSSDPELKSLDKLRYTSLNHKKSTIRVLP